MTSSSDPDAIRREIERTQVGLSRDVDLLTEKVTPSKIVERRVGRVRDTATRWKDTVMGSSTSAGRTAGARVVDASTSATSAVSDAPSRAVGAVEEAPRVVRQQAQGNPLAAGLIAFGAGWLISSLIPASNREQELAEEVKDRATELGQPLVDQAKQAATEVRDNLAPQAENAVDSVRSTATDAWQNVADEGRAAAGRVQERAQDAAGTVRHNGSG